VVIISENAMAFIPVDKVAQANIRALLFGQRIENTLYFSQPVSGWDGAALLAAATALSTWWNDNLLPLLSASYILQSVFMRDLTSEDGDVVEWFGDNGEAGADTNASAPSNVAFVVKFLTGLAGRSFRGRNYIGGLGAENYTANAVALSTVNGIIAAYQDLIDGLVADVGTWVVVSRFSAGAPRTAGLASPILTVGYSDLFVDSQRRRLTGRGT
jgi:hypothetical protein